MDNGQPDETTVTPETAEQMATACTDLAQAQVRAINVAAKAAGLPPIGVAASLWGLLTGYLIAMKGQGWVESKVTLLAAMDAETTAEFEMAARLNGGKVGNA